MTTGLVSEMVKRAGVLAREGMSMVEQNESRVVGNERRRFLGRLQIEIRSEEEVESSERVMLTGLVVICLCFLRLYTRYLRSFGLTSSVVATAAAVTPSPSKSVSLDLLLVNRLWTDPPLDSSPSLWWPGPSSTALKRRARN